MSREKQVTPIIEIDEHSGFCFGVINAIKHAERELEETKGALYSLGDIVHNSEEVSRLEAKGLKTIDYEQLKGLRHKRVLFRAHGEPPEVYQWAKERSIELVDATCPVVVRLQHKIRKKYQESRAENAQIVIYGKRGHAEVNGLVGQTGGEAIVLTSLEEISMLDMSRPIILFSQTTQPLKTFRELIERIEQEIDEGVRFEYHDTVCRQVSNRIPNIEQFSAQHELVFFIAGKKSSNGKVLYSYCQKSNPRSIFLSSERDLSPEMLEPMPRSIGICGATSTPRWQMEAVRDRLKEMIGID